MEPNMTWLDLVRKHFPDAFDDFCDWVLWERTCFPVGSVEKVEAQILKLKEGEK